jgi:hypothetical protein
MLRRMRDAVVRGQDANTTQGEITPSKWSRPINTKHCRPAIKMKARGRRIPPAFVVQNRPNLSSVNECSDISLSI